jgi:APA family basic amino acid/polyamine antiporter
LSGTYSELLDYVIFAQLMFYVVTVAAVFVLRGKRPDASRPYRAFGYPWIPIAYIAAASAMMIDLLIVKPTYTWPGVLIVLTGVPVYFLFARRTATLR